MKRCWREEGRRRKTTEGCRSPLPQIPVPSKLFSGNPGIFTINPTVATSKSTSHRGDWEGLSSYFSACQTLPFPGDMTLTPSSEEGCEVNGGGGKAHH